MVKVVESKSLDYFNLVDTGTKTHGIILGKDFKPIPKIIFSEVLDIVIYYAKQKLEVLFYIYYDDSNNYVVTVPTQKVSNYRIKVCPRDDLNYKELNVLSKSQVNTNRLIRLGSIHSHHELKANFSIDDDISDFNGPPGLHILLGEFPNIKVVSSFACLGKRFYINPTSIINYDDMHYTNSDFDRNFLNNAIKEQITKY